MTHRERYVTIGVSQSDKCDILSKLLRNFVRGRVQSILYIPCSNRLLLRTEMRVVRHCMQNTTKIVRINY